MTVRYFTRGWVAGELTGDECEHAKAAYWARVAEITPRLPPDLARMVGEIRLHDGIIEQVVWNSHLNRLQLSLVGENTREECVAVQLTYGGAMLGSDRLASLKRAALSRETELLYDEVDLGIDGVLSHRLLFTPSEEVTIDFRDFGMQVSPRADRRVHLWPAFTDD